MATIPNEIINNAKKFISLVSSNGIHIEKAMLFGSYAKGMAHQWSDIDIALVSNDFTGIGFYDRQRINPYLIKIDSRIEPHPFRPEDFNNENPFVEEILKQGLAI